MKHKSPTIRKLTSQRILRILDDYKPELKRYNLAKLGLFGSFSKGIANKHSDIDFLVRFKTPSFDNYIELKFLLEKVFKKKIDLVMEENLKPSLQYVKKEAHYIKEL